MMDDLPTSYDAIVVGTGMVESIIAAALSRIGKSVLHLDSEEYYGENWASFNLENIEAWIDDLEKNTVEKNVKDYCFSSLINENERVINVSRRSNISNVQKNQYVHNNINTEISESPEKKIIESEGGNEEENNETNLKEESLSANTLQSKIKNLSRRFNLDLCPKLLFSRGSMVELLISSNIAKYAEFKSLSRVLTWRNHQLEPVPCSRADVFATKNVSVVDKRILVKILSLFANYTNNLDEFKGFEEKTFLEFLTQRKLPKNLIHYILYAIAMGDETTPCLDGVKACNAFLKSLGRYGNTPFIFPMYGSGELPQCFCRLCAVFGGIYCLQRGIEGLVLEGNKCTAVISNGIRLNTKAAILSSSYVLKDYSFVENFSSISRGIFITDGSILKSDKQGFTLLQFPPALEVSNKPVTVIELGSGTNTCPEDFFVVHLTTKAIKDASTDLKYVIDALFESEGQESDQKPSKPRIVWSLTWNVTDGATLKESSLLENVKVCSSIDSELDYDFSINEAKRIFNELYPDEEFLPRAPDPDEIVLDSDEKSNEESDKTSENVADAEENLAKIVEEETVLKEDTNERINEGDEVRHSNDL